MRPTLAIVIVVAAIGLRVFGLSGDLTDHDAWRQTETATQAHFFLETPNLLWPRVAWGDPGPGFVECELPLFPWLTHLLYRAFGENPLYGRLLAVLFLALSCWPMHALARRFLSPAGSAFALALYAFAPVVFSSTRAFMPESLALLGAVVALERFTAWLDTGPDATGRSRDLALSAAAMALAFLVKPTSLHLGLPLLVMAWSRFGTGTFRRPGLWAFALAALLPGALWYWHGALVHRDYGNTFGVISGGDSKWGNPAWWTSWTFYRDLLRIDLFYGCGPLAAPLLALGLWFDRRRHALWLPLVAGWLLAAGIYYLAVARYCGSEGRGAHYHIYTAALLALLAGKGLDAVWARGWLPRLLALLLALLCVGDLVRRDFRTTRIQTPQLREAGLALARLSAPNETVLVLSMAPQIEDGVQNNFEQPDVFFHAQRRGRSLPIDDQTPERFARSVSPSTQWFVNLPWANDKADPRFLPWLREHWQRVEGTGYWEIWRRRFER